MPPPRASTVLGPFCCGLTPRPELSSRSYCNNFPGLALLSACSHSRPARTACACRALLCVTPPSLALLSACSHCLRLTSSALLDELCGYLQSFRWASTALGLLALPSRVELFCSQGQRSTFWQEQRLNIVCRKCNACRGCKCAV